MFCKQCGQEIRECALFCKNCGAQQNPAPSVQNVDEDLEKTIGIFTQIPDFQQVQTIQPPVVETQETPVVETPAASVHQALAQPQNDTKPTLKTSYTGKVGFGKAVALFFQNYVNFKGRASKSEYWWVFLFRTLLFLPLVIISIIAFPLGAMCSIVLTIPGISLAVRRLHDTGKSGAYWFMGMIPLAGRIILLIEFLKDSKGDNKYGPGPSSARQTDQASISSSAPKVITDNDIYVMTQKHEPVNVNTPEAKEIMDSALSRIVPTYTGIENLAGAVMLCDPQSIKASIAATDTETLIVIVKALHFYIGQNADSNILGAVQQNVLSVLKTRF